ncbi:hypothetical protein LBMAG53_09680 [Planctomycetota bacterium]|nr:hypothetical protein LBMAG53_09680 [Planctomycetota bacterium]
MTPARLNPFRSERIESLAFRPTGPGQDLAGIQERWEKAGRRGAVVGPHGSGKTTLVEQLGRRLGDTTWVDVRPGVAPVTSSSVLLLDGLERLPWLTRRSWLAACCAPGLIATLHRPGCGLPVLLRTTTTPDVLENLVAELLGQPVDDHRAAECRRLFAEHRGDLRACLETLYRRWAGEESG